MSNPRWEIFIPTVVDRGEKFQRLVNTLAPQVEKYKGQIIVTILWNNYEHELSELRQSMIEQATGDYVNFIDDDDNVADNYCDKIFPLLDGVDYIGFRVAFYQNNQKQKQVVHSLTSEGWFDNGEGYFRRGTLINPTKRELMLKAGFNNSDYRKGIPEDTTYASDVDPYLKTEHFIEEEVHIYMPTDDHAWSRFEAAVGEFKRPTLPKYFKFHPWSTK